MDPDEYIRAYGAEAFREVLNNAMSLVEFQWMRVLQGKDLRTPEAKAKVETELEELCLRIKDSTVRRHYQVAFRELCLKHFGTARQEPARQVARAARPALRVVQGGAATSALARRDYVSGGLAERLRAVKQEAASP